MPKAPALTLLDPVTYTFLKEWIEWVEAGIPKHDWFMPAVGLCSNSFDPNALREILVKDFGDDFEFPFGGASVYSRESEHKITHTNPLRLAWVRQKISEHEKAATPCFAQKLRIRMETSFGILKPILY